MKEKLQETKAKMAELKDKQNRKKMGVGTGAKVAGVVIAVGAVMATGVNYINTRDAIVNEIETTAAEVATYAHSDGNYLNFDDTTYEIYNYDATNPDTIMDDIVLATMAKDSTIDMGTLLRKGQNIDYVEIDGQIYTADNIAVVEKKFTYPATEATRFNENGEKEVTYFAPMGGTLIGDQVEFTIREMVSTEELTEEYMSSVPEAFKKIDGCHLQYATIISKSYSELDNYAVNYHINDEKQVHYSLKRTK